MHSNPKILEYRFDGYRLSNQEQCLYHHRKTLSLSTKVYYLLLTLVENAGQVMSKDEIIEAVWPGQVVTDTALAKQVLRLRKLLKDPHREKPFIETHRGVGYRFTPQVEAISAERPPYPAAGAPQPRSWLGFLTLVLVLGGTYLLSEWLRDTGTGPFGEVDQAVSLAVLQMSDNPDWMNLGGVEYLSDLLNSHDLVYTFPQQGEWFESGTRDEVAVALTGYEHINYSCILEFSQQDDRFRVRASLRNNDGQIAATEIEVEELSLAFEQTDQWIRNQLKVDRDAELRANPPPTRDNYALQSYLQGLRALRAEGDIKTAAEYFRAAVNSDPDFTEAWVKLARSLTDLGDQQGALAIGLTLLERPALQDNEAVNVEAHFVIARSYNRLSERDQATTYLNKTRDIIASTDNPYIKLDGLESLALLARLENDVATAEALALERLALAKVVYPVPNYLAAIHLQLASFFDLGRQLEKLVEHAEEAIRLSEAGHNPNGMMSGYRYLSSYYFATNRLDEGVQLAIQAEPFLERSAVSHDKAFFLQFAAMTMNLRGMFDRSERYSTLLRELALESSNSMYEVLSDFTSLHRLYVREQFDEARAYAQAMRARFRNDAVMISALPDAMVIEASVASRAGDAQQAILLLAELDDKFGSSKVRLRNDLNRVRGHIAVQQGRFQEGIDLLLDAEQAIRSQKQQSVANYIGYEVLQVLLDQPDLEYQSVIDRLEHHTDYDYHFLKLKAQFEAREGNFTDAAMLMQENRLRANQLWTPKDQLLLESFYREAGDHRETGPYLDGQFEAEKAL